MKDPLHLWANRVVAAVEDERRRYRRRPCHGLTCDLGTITDLSPAGMRVEGRGTRQLARGQIHHLTVEGPQTRLPLRVQVIWFSPPRGIRRSFAAGFRFVALTRDLVQRLQRLADDAASV